MWWPGTAMDGPCQPFGMRTTSPSRTSASTSVSRPGPDGETRW